MSSRSGPLWEHPRLNHHASESVRSMKRAERLLDEDKPADAIRIYKFLLDDATLPLICRLKSNMMLFQIVDDLDTAEHYLKETAECLETCRAETEIDETATAETWEGLEKHSATVRKMREQLAEERAGEVKAEADESKATGEAKDKDPRTAATATAIDQNQKNEGKATTETEEATGKDAEPDEGGDDDEDDGHDPGEYDPQDYSDEALILDADSWAIMRGKLPPSLR